jgi:ParB family chromosome partitioning protein
VRDVEAIDASGGRKKGAGGRKPRAKDADTRALEKSLSDLLGLTVEIDHKSGGGQIHIHYASLEQLDDVCRRLRG